MDLNINICSSCKVRVLLIPVSPIKKSTFDKHVELLKTFCLVRLGDVTPDLKKGASAMFSSQVFQEGQMHFEFLTHYTREHQELEEFQPHRRVFGIIGIMDCQEWKTKGLYEGYKQFEKDLDMYPAGVVTRCFGFDPSESQEDNTKGLIMIPNVGNMSFYMSTMMCDFASDILELFGTLAHRIQNTTMLESPLPLRLSHIPVQQREHPRFSQPPLTLSAQNTSISKRSSFPLQSPRVSETTGETSRTKKRTSGRIRKLLGDFYLLAGRLPDAVNFYEHAMEMTKMTSDYLWLASAMEGWLCATVLLEYLQMDHIVSRTPMGSYQSDSVVDDTIEFPPTPTTAKGPRSTLHVLAEHYGLLIHNYSRVMLTASFPVPDVVFAEACMKIARILTTAYLNDGWNHETITLIVQGQLHHGILTQGQFKQGSGVSRSDIGEWVTKIWEIQLEHLALLDQISLTNAMSCVYSSIGYHRKAAYTMHKSIQSMLPLLIQYRRANLKENNTVSDQGVLEILRRMCDIYGVGQHHVRDRGTLFDQTQPTLKPTNTACQLGWPELQIEILKQCISVSEALIDHGSRLYYTTILLRNLYQYIPKAEQIKLATTIQAIVMNSTRDKKIKTSSINYWGVNIVSHVEAKKPISRKAVYAQPIKSDTVIDSSNTEASNDPFIYNPFAKKTESEQKVMLVKNELSEFKVSLVNPFGFDLELQNIVLSTSGVAFHAIPTALTIPANATIHVQLMGTPEETGALVIRGCFIRIIGFAEQEFLVNTSDKESSKHQHFIKIKHRYLPNFSGLNALDFSKNKEEKTNDSSPAHFYTVNVIEDQPLLKIKKTSLLHSAVMLYEGEVIQMTIDLENIGLVPVDFVTLSFVDSTTSSPVFINPELPPEDQYEIELYTKGTSVFSWEGTSEKRSNELIGKKIWLPPGAITTIKINVYGKRDCRGGTIQIDYGYLDRTKSSSTSRPETALFHTRQLYLNVLITVYQNLECLNWDVAHLRHSIPASKEAIEVAMKRIRQTTLNDLNIPSEKQPVEDVLLVTRNIELENQEINDFCLVTVDVHNIWTVPFDVEFTINHADKREKDHILSRTTIQAGSTVRIILPIKRLFLPNSICNQAIPSFDPNKQFVVSQGPNISKEQQAARLQMFWYREELLDSIKASWKCRVSHRSGRLNLRPSLRMSSTQLGILKKEDVAFSIDMKGKSVEKLSHRRFSCLCNDYVILTISVKNRFSYPIKLILRLQPVQSYNDGVKEYDLSDKLFIEGLKQVVLPEIPAIHGFASYSFPLYFLSRGQFELLYHAEDIYRRKVYYDHEWVIVDATE